MISYFADLFPQYEKLRAQATTMKDKYEERIQTLEEERDEAAEDAGKSAQTAELQQEVQTLRQQLQQARADAKVEGSKSQQNSAQSQGSTADVATEVRLKKNFVYTYWSFMNSRRSHRGEAEEKLCLHILIIYEQQT